MDKQASFDFPDEPQVTRSTQPTIKVKVGRESRSLCNYCGVMVPIWALDKTPALGDTPAWKALTPYHGTGCRWVSTKGLKADA